MGVFTQNFELYANSVAAARDLFPRLWKGKFFAPARMRMALLIMVGFCAHNLAQTLNTLSVSDMSLESRNETASTWRKDWSMRRRVQYAKLNSKTKASFKAWLGSTGLMG